MSPSSLSRSTVVATLGVGAALTLIVAATAAGARPTPPAAPHAARPPAGPVTPPSTPPPPEAYVELFDELHLDGVRLTLRPGNDIKSLDGVPADGGMMGFEDKPASVRWNIPVGWQLVLFEHKNFEGDRLELKGTGRIEDTPDLGCFVDKASSARWEYRR